MLHPVYRRGIAGIARFGFAFGDRGAFADEPVRESARNFVDGVLFGVFRAQENGAQEANSPRSPSLFTVRFRPRIDRRTCVRYYFWIFICRHRLLAFLVARERNESRPRATISRARERGKKIYVLMTYFATTNARGYFSVTSVSMNVVSSIIPCFFRRYGSTTNSNPLPHMEIKMVSKIPRMSE